MEIREFDPAADLAEWTALNDVVHAELHPDEPLPTLAMRLSYLSPRQDEDIRAWTAELDGRLAGFGMTAMFTRENAHLAVGEVLVHPELRRRGVGTALADRLFDAARTTGRTAFVCDTPEDDAVGAAFLEGYGFKRVQTELLNVLRLAAAASEIPAWAAGGEAKTAGWTLIRWSDRCPDDVIEAFALAQDGMNDMPTGEMDLRPSHLSVEQLRKSEDWALRHSRRKHTVAVREDATGRIGGFHSVAEHAGYPWIQVGSTAVMPYARGNGFGLWLKAALVEWLRADAPAVTGYVTGNAAENEHMLRINRRLGYVPLQTFQTWQAEL